MTARKSRLLVIDASVMRSAGETDHPVSSACRDALLMVRKICHRVALTANIRTEWKIHMSRFSRKWLLSMAARKKSPYIKPKEFDLDMTGLSEKDRVAVEKDIHLVKAAFSADSIILTLDDSLRQALAKTRSGTNLLETIKWINPFREADLLNSL